MVLTRNKLPLQFVTMLSQNNFIFLTRMHSSRKYTTRTLPYGVVSLTETPWTVTPWTDTIWTETPWTETPSWTETPWIETPLDRDSPGQRPPWTETPLDRDPAPPMNRITDRCKNITFPQLRCERKRCHRISASVFQRYS